MVEITLSEETLEEWQKEAEELRSRLAQLETRIRVLHDVLVEVKQESGGQPELPLSEPDKAFVGLRQSEAMLAILKEVGEPLNGPQIREALCEKGYPLEKWGVRNAYFYAIAKTLVDTGKVIKGDDKRYAIPPDSYTITEAWIPKNPPEPDFNDLSDTKSDQ